jgi:hypothetical protein
MSTITPVPPDRKKAVEGERWCGEHKAICGALGVCDDGGGGGGGHRANFGG